MPRKVLISYSNANYRSAIKLLESTALSVGKVDEFYGFTTNDVSIPFRAKNQHILRKKRGAGYWLWKPYLILRVLEALKPEDVLLYADASVMWLADAEELLRPFAKSGQFLMAFDIFTERNIEQRYTKRDTFIAMDCDTPAYTETRQRMSTICIWRPGQESIAFARAWLACAEEAHLLTDSPSKVANYSGFFEHRHDQSIFSLLSKKHGIIAHRDPLVQNTSYMGAYPHSTYDCVIWVSRKRNKRLLHGFLAGLARELPQAYRLYRNHLRPVYLLMKRHFKLSRR